MKWIADKKPEYSGQYFTKVFDGVSIYPKVSCFTLDMWEVNDEHEEVVEWLDETPDQAAHVSDAIAFARNDFDRVFCLGYFQQDKWETESMIDDIANGNLKKQADLAWTWYQDFKSQSSTGKLEGFSDIERLYEWLVDEKREPAQTFFTASYLRDVAKEIEFRLATKQS